jgi:hypothetical protein
LHSDTWLICAAISPAEVGPVLKRLQFFVPVFSLAIFAFLTSPSIGQEVGSSSTTKAKEMDRDDPARRAAWFWHGRIAPPGESSAELRHRAYQQKMQMRAARAAQASAAAVPHAAQLNQWTPLGPAPLLSDATTPTHSGGLQDYLAVSGRATSVLIDPADTTGNTVYLGGAFGGLWKSVNAAASDPKSVTWTPLIDQKETLAVGAIAVRPGGGVLLAGTGEANSSGDSYYGLGVLRSTDSGATWSLIASADGTAHPFKGLAFSRIAWSTANTSLVVATTAGSPVAGFTGAGTTGTRGIYYSTDAGVTWKLATVKDGSVALTAPAASASGVVYNAAANKFFAAIRAHGIYSSTDGANWTRLVNQPDPSGFLGAGNCPSTSNATTCHLYRAELAAVPGRNELYTWIVWIDFTNGTVNDGGIWRTTNGGTSWIQLTEAGLTDCGDGGGCGVSQGTYNLELAAVPNGSATDLYAGAINLYKCTLADSQVTTTTCTNPNANPTTSWMNLTHVYGCNPLSSLAHVHPDQHALDFKVLSGGSDLMYFANDGGIYRALDGFTGLTTGDCAGTNAFDTLNTNLSMTQFVSFSQHPTDFNTILGGTQDNGSPASASATASTLWFSVNGGDGGFNEINPSNPNEWFVTNTDVTIQRCLVGSLCLGQLFPYVVLSDQVGGDHGAFYTSYTLDPAATTNSELIVGTCRVWRGTGDGITSGWATSTPAGDALSFNFETGTVVACTGNEVNLVRSLAVGGAKDTNGLSKVIYAVTDGTGPVTGAAGGQIFGSTNAGGGTAQWLNLSSAATGFANPNHYPISDAAMDPADATGSTAYVTVQGFGGAHVWKTTNAGTNWTDFTGTGVGALPDAPANSVVVDGGTVYVGTDVGVFSSATGAASWTEVGPAPASGNAGYIPNVPVTKLRMFNSNGNRLLRASTYGRGIWEFPLSISNDYLINISNTAQTIYVGQTATFSGTLSASGSYSSPVNLSCAAGSTNPPTTCAASSSPVTPTAGGAPFSINASGAAGPYTFNVQGVGTDVSSTQHSAPVTLNIVDFTLGAPNPASVSVNVPNTSNPIQFTVTPVGPFTDTVVLTCNNLPAGANCNFSPSASLNVVPNTPVPVTLTISTASSPPAGTYSNVQISAQAVTNPAPAPRTQTLTLTVTAGPDFSITATSPTFLANYAGRGSIFTGTLTSFNGYNKNVTISCAGAPASVTCTPLPNQLVPNSGGVAFQVTAIGTTPGAFNFNIQVSDGTITHTVPITFSVLDFGFATSGASTATVSSGQTATFALAFTLQGGTNYPFAVTYSCANITPANSLLTCSFNPTQLTANSAAQTVTLSVTSTGFHGTQIKPQSRNSRNRLFLPLGVSAFGLVLAGWARGRPFYKWKVVMDTSLAMVLIGVLVACGGGSSPPPPAQVSVSVAAASPTPFIGQTDQMTPTVRNATNTAVTWSLSGAGCSGTTCGSIDSNGLYTAPSAVPNPANVTITATSQQDSTKSGAAIVTVQQSTPPTTYTITVTATDGTLSHSTNVTLTVN